MKLIPNDTDLRGMDCHVHSVFSPDSSQTPDEIVAAVRRRGLRGFIITDHVDIGHWQGCKPIDFAEYFRVWNKVRDDNPDLTVFVGLEVGFEKHTARESKALVEALPFEYIVNSVHYWINDGKHSHYELGKERAYSEYIEAVSASLDAPYEFSTVGHFGFIERYAPFDGDERIMDFATFEPLMNEIIGKAMSRGVRFEENTNGGGELRLPRADFLSAYKAAGGVRPVVSSDAHIASAIGQYFKEAELFLTRIFGK